MSQTTSLELSERILNFLRDQLGIEDALNVDTPLVTNGLVDSVGLMRLAAFLEQITGATSPDQDINVGHFDTIRQIETYLRDRVS